MSVNHIEFLYIKFTPTCNFKETPPKTSHLQIDPSFSEFRRANYKVVEGMRPKKQWC